MRYEATFLEKAIFKECYFTEPRRPYPVPRRKRSLPDTYTQTYECGKSSETTPRREPMRATEEEPTCGPPIFEEKQKGLDA
ncbi:hypothetical protein ACTXT7_002080 [Hymenolepis weldensis]